MEEFTGTFDEAIAPPVVVTQGGASKLKPLPFFKPADYKWQPEVQDFRSRVSLAMTIRSRFDVGSAARSRDAQDQRDIETINAILALDELAATQKRRRMLLDMLAELY